MTSSIHDDDEMEQGGADGFRPVVPPPGGPGEAVGRPVRLCVIDLGTNSFHAIIVDAYANGTFTTLDRIKEMVRLGEGGFTKHRLTGAARRRGMEALRRIRLLAEGWQVSDYLAYATSAIREAENGGDFIQRVQAELGLRIRPISGEMEARLIYRGVRRALDIPEPTLLVDIGGGSTEFVVGTGDIVHHAASHKLGAARLTEWFIHADPAQKSELKALRAHCRETLAGLFTEVRTRGVRTLIGSSGTLLNLGQVYAAHHGLSAVPPEINAASFREQVRAVMRMPRDARAALPGLDEKRVDQVVAGATLIDVLLKDLPIARVRLTGSALREGMVLQYIERNTRRLAHLAPFDDVRRRSVYELGFRCQWDEAHARQVAGLALLLFDACGPLHGLGRREREWLEFAALLHDVGYHISHRSHHKHSLYLIEHADLRGFTPDEVAVIANTARYHRRSFPKKTHPAYMALRPAHRRVVRQLAALLRLAEGLDRSRFQNVTALRVRITDDAVGLALRTNGDPALEQWGVRHEKALFERTYRRALRLEEAEETDEN